jgi:hypothetical protein
MLTRSALLSIQFGEKLLSVNEFAAIGFCN